MVKNGWNVQVNGVPQFWLAKKMCGLKSPIRSLLFQQGNVHAKVGLLRGKLDDIQRSIDLDPLNSDLRVQ